MNGTDSLSVWIDRFLMPIDDPGSRLFHWNILISILLILVWAIGVFGFRQSTIQIKGLLFRKKYWWNRSTKRDYAIYLLNSALKALWFIPLLDFSFQMARFVSESLVALNGDFADFTPTTGAIALFTVLSFVFDDLLRFLQHYGMHKHPFLWKIHSTHHSAKILTPLSLYRTHPFESALATLRNSLSLGVSAGVFVFLFESQLSVWTIAGVNVFGFLFNLLGANLRHSHIPLGFPRWLESFFISPLQHQIHHSSAGPHQNQNFGVSLAVWDRLVGSWLPSQKNLKLKFGLGNRQLRPWKEELGWTPRTSRASNDVRAKEVSWVVTLFPNELKQKSN